MKAIFYNQDGKEVWSTTKDCLYHLNTKPPKNAKRGVLLNEKGEIIDEAKYGPF